MFQDGVINPDGSISNPISIYENSSLL